jgi:hypothetical protein
MPAHMLLPLSMTFNPPITFLPTSNAPSPFRSTCLDSSSPQKLLSSHAQTMYSRTIIILASALFAGSSSAAAVANADAVSILPRQVHWNSGSGGVRTGRRGVTVAPLEERQVHWNSGSGGVRSQSCSRNNVICQLTLPLAGKRDSDPNTAPVV